MDIIKENCVVEFDFSLTTKRGEVVDSSKEEGPLRYIHGKKRISPLLEKNLTGKKVGQKFQIEVKPEDAYGVRDEGLIQFAKKELFGDNFNKVTVGMPLELEGANGETAIMMAVEIREDGIVLDGNHPLAGETLTYDVTILSVREATEEDLKE